MENTCHLNLVLESRESDDYHVGKFAFCRNVYTLPFGTTFYARLLGNFFLRV